VDDLIAKLAGMSLDPEVPERHRATIHSAIIRIRETSPGQWMQADRQIRDAIRDRVETARRKLTED
jgi:hypothetical protein